MAHCPTAICDQFLFVDLCDQEFCRAFVQIKANHQIAVVEHVMANAVEDNDMSDEEYDGMDTFEYVNGMEDDGYNTDTSQHMGAGSLINTIRQKFEGLTPREVKEDILARTVQLRIGNPTEKKYKHMASVNSLKECPVRPKHITYVAHSFGPLISVSEGKIMKHLSARVQVAKTSVLDNFRRLHRVVTLTADVMFVNGVSLLITLSSGIKLYTMKHIPSCT